MNHFYLKYSIAIFFLAISFNCFGQNPNPNSTLDATIEGYMNTYNLPGASTLIVKNGEIVWVESYGYADISNSVAVEDTTVFLLASVSKLFTGTAVMQLDEIGTIDLDKDINQYLPWTVDIPNYENDSITMRQIMTHTSSIKDNWGTMANYYGYPDPTMSLANCMERYFTSTGEDFNPSSNFLNQPPGFGYEYSNMATALNGYVVEVNSNMGFDDYCDTYLFEPLCMENTGWHFSDFNPNQVAIPYSYDNGNYLPNDHYGFADYPDGQLRSNVIDLANYMIAFLNEGNFNNNNILSAASVNEMLTFQIPSLDGTQGLNWYQTELYHSGGEAMLWGHNGGETGVSTYLFIDPENDLGIILLANGSGEGLYICDALYDHALNMTFNNSIEPGCQPTASISKNDKNDDILIYPNPADKFIQIDYDFQHPLTYSIYSLSGQLLSSGNICSESDLIDVSDISSGLYFFHLDSKSVQLLEIR